MGGGGGNGGGGGGGGRRRLYTYCYTVTTRMSSALRWAAMRAILMFDWLWGTKHKTASTDHNFWRQKTAEADSNRGPSAYQPNALPLGQTGSLRHCNSRWDNNQIHTPAQSLGGQRISKELAFSKHVLFHRQNIQRHVQFLNFVALLTISCIQQRQRLARGAHTASLTSAFRAHVARGTRWFRLRAAGRPAVTPDDVFHIQSIWSLLTKTGFQLENKVSCAL